MAEARSAAAQALRTPGSGARSEAKRCPSCAGRYPADFRVCPRDAALLEDAPPDDDPLIGSTLSETYEVLRVVGEGGMGCVYEARHVRLPNKRFAVKVLHSDLLRQSEVVARFEREAEAASAFSHEHAVGVLDVNRTADGRPYIVSELLEGEQLGDHLARAGKLPAGEAIRIASQLCRALGAAHARGVVHRDIKPENVFLVGEGAARAVKVLDFGISKVGSGSSTLTKTGVVMGTPAYMPPEQARGQHVDHRADIYAVGVILYRAVTGKLPFEGPDPLATLTAVIAREAVRPSMIEAALPLALEIVIQTAMNKKPAERYPSMQAFEAALAAIDPGASTQASTSNAPANHATAHTLLAYPAEDRAAGRSRPQLIVLSAAAALSIAAGLLDVSISAIRGLHDGAALSGTEVVLTAAGVLALLIAPSIAWARFVAERIWPNTPRAIEVAARLERILAIGLVAYGCLALGLRVLHAIGRDNSQATGDFRGALLMFAGAVSAATVAWLRERMRRRK
jgi:serine/threonine protein kinase